jgi:integrase
MWTLPAARAKNDKPHDIPLSQAALDLIDHLPRSNSQSLLFPAANASGKAASGISKAKRRMDEGLSNYLGAPLIPWVIHDLRRTVATKMEGLKIIQPVVEAVLNHIAGSKAGIVVIYQRYKYIDDKRDALDKWAAELMRICRH